MDRSPSGAVVAGTRAFSAALLAPLAARVGTRPRVAADAAQALALCPGPGGVAVIEYAGEGSLPAIERLVREGGARVLVAVAPEHRAAEAALRALGAEPIGWDGRPEPVVAALGAIAPAAAPAPAIAVVGPAHLAAPRAAGATATAPEQPALLEGRAAGEPAPRGAAITPLPATVAAAAWPATAPGPAEAERALAGSLAGALPPGAALASAAEQVVAGLTALEREVLAGDPQPFDAAPVRAAAVMRLRVAAALASAPPPGAPVDGAALQRILGEIDGLLAQVKALLAGAPAEARLPLEAVRNALVREAIRFSEAAAGGAIADAPAATPPPAAPAPRREPARAGAAPRPVVAAPGERRRPAVLLAILALSAAGAGGYHAWRLLARRPAPPPSYPGAPAGTFRVDRGANRLLMTLPGQRVDPAELERFGRLEAARGNVVRPVSPGTWIIERAPAAEARP